MSVERLTVNGKVVDGRDYPSPEAAISRELLRQRALTLGLLGETADPEDIDRAADVILDREVIVPTPTREECLRYYEGHPDDFTSGELAFARHILFQVTPGVPVPALRAKAELLLAALIRAPEEFDRLARENSNCPSGSHGGVLGQLGRGETVPEFDLALFNGGYIGVYPQLLRTRFGFHILAVDRREPGQRIPFHLVRERIAAHLGEKAQRAALVQYVRRLAGAAKIIGIDDSSLIESPVR